MADSLRGGKETEPGRILKNITLTGKHTHCVTHPGL